jgi:hypothetical protein
MMKLRDCLIKLTLVMFGLPLLLLISWQQAAVGVEQWPVHLPQTEQLEINQTLDVLMIRGLSRFAELELAGSLERREQHWSRDFSSHVAYERSVAANRDRVR